MTETLSTETRSFADSLAIQVLSAGTLLLTPVDELRGASSVGQVRQFDIGPAGLALHVAAEVAPATAHALAGQRVWATVRPAQGSLVAFQAVARPDASRAGVLELTGVAGPVYERRRAQLRAPARFPAALVVNAGSAPAYDVRAQTVDMSRASCRVRLLTDEPSQAMPAEGSRVGLTVDLDGQLIAAQTVVIRTDPVAAEAVLSFTTASPEDLARIDRHVLSELSGS